MKQIEYIQIKKTFSDEATNFIWDHLGLIMKNFNAIEKHVTDQNDSLYNLIAKDVMADIILELSGGRWEDCGTIIQQKMWLRKVLFPLGESLNEFQFNE